MERIDCYRVCLPGLHRGCPRDDGQVLAARDVCTCHRDGWWRAVWPQTRGGSMTSPTTEAIYGQLADPYDPGAVCSCRDRCALRGVDIHPIRVLRADRDAEEDGKPAPLATPETGDYHRLHRGRRAGRSMSSRACSPSLRGAGCEYPDIQQADLCISKPRSGIHKSCFRSHLCVIHDPQWTLWLIYSSL